MADNVAITAGSGTTIASDDVSGVHYQRVKLVDGTLDSTAAIGGDATNGLDVDVTRMSSLVAGTAYVGKVRITDGTTDTVVSTSGALYVGGSTAHDAADAGNPIKVGAKAETSLAGATLVADGDRTDLYADSDGLLMTKPYTAYGDILVERISNTNGTSTAFSTFGAVASTRNYVTTISVYNDSTTNAYVDFRDGTAGTVLFTLPLPAKGGAVCNFTLPLRQPTANTAFAYDVSAGLTTVYISIIGFQSKV